MLTRRRFLIDGLKVTAAVPLLSSLGGQPLRSGAGDGERVLVVVQLSGGNDALNTVVPHRQDIYYRSRPSLALARGGLHALDDDHGLHPAMGGLGELFEEGRVAIHHGVGYPEPNRSHFRSMEIWHTADPENPPGDTGWLGRMADQVAKANPGAMAALQVGRGNLPLALFGRAYFAPTVRDANGFRLREGPDEFEDWRLRMLDNERRGTARFLGEAASATYDAAARMALAAERNADVDYPGYPLAQQLHLVARLITGGFDTRIFHVALDGFDTHARQKSAHEALLRELSDSLAAFQRDLANQGVADRVTTLVFSEFGRRVAENGSKGTDHGAAAPVFLVGGAVRGGMHGTAPDLEGLERGDVPFTTDFRSVYTTLEADWMGLRPSTGWPALKLLVT